MRGEARPNESGESRERCSGVRKRERNGMVSERA